MSGPTSPEPTDAALVAAYRAGDDLAARELVGRHARALARFLYGSGAVESDIEDLAQEAFFRAFRRIDGWRGEASFRSWLFTIASNLVKDAFRTRRRGETVALAERDLAGGSDPEGELAATDTAERLRDGISRLPRLQREVFLLRVQEGADYREIAAAVGTTPGAARVHYHHAVRRLKELLQ